MAKTKDLKHFIEQHAVTSSALLQGGLEDDDFVGAQLGLDVDDWLIMKELLDVMAVSSLERYGARRSQGYNAVQVLAIMTREAISLGLALGADITKNYEKQKEEPNG